MVLKPNNDLLVVFTGCLGIFHCIFASTDVFSSIEHRSSGGDRRRCFLVQKYSLG